MTILETEFSFLSRHGAWLTFGNVDLHLKNREEQQAPWKNKERKCASWENRETGELLQIFCKSAGFEQYSKNMGALNKLLISNMGFI